MKKVDFRELLVKDVDGTPVAAAVPPVCGCLSSLAEQIYEELVNVIQGMKGDVTQEQVQKVFETNLSQLSTAIIKSKHILEVLENFVEIIFTTKKNPDDCPMVGVIRECREATDVDARATLQETMINVAMGSDKENKFGTKLAES